jgi:F-type H+-transporting ATPase subunit a
MPHGMSWFNFLPGFENLQEFIRHTGGKTWLMGGAIGIQHTLAAVLVFVFMLFVSVRARGQLAASESKGVIPGPKFNSLNFVEVIAQAVYGQLQQLCGKEARRFFPVISSLALFIFFSNTLGLIPGFSPPTDNLNTTFACGLFIFLYYNYHAFRVQGIGHITHMANPVGEWWGWFLAPLLFPIELISHIARPLSLSLRLMGNMIGDHAVLGAFVGIIPFIVPLPFFVLGFVVCIVQTVVFCLLSMVYLSLAVSDSHHGDDHGHGDAKAHA